MSTDFEAEDGLSPLVATLDQLNPGERNRYGGKAVNLAFMRQAGINVPEGIVLSTEVHQEYLRSGQVPPSVIEQIMLAQRNWENVAIRSSGTLEDGCDHTMAGIFETEYVFAGQNPVEALFRVYDQAFSAECHNALVTHGFDPNNVEMGIVVQRLIQPEFAGVAYTIDDHRILIQYDRGLGNRVVDGDTEGGIAILDLNEGVITSSIGYESHVLPPSVIEDIIEDTKKLSAIYDNMPLDLEFAVDASGKLFILQARELTTPIEIETLNASPEQTLRETKSTIKAQFEAEKARTGIENPVITCSNYTELLPRPRNFSIGIFQYAFTGTNENFPGATQLGRWEMGYRPTSNARGYMRPAGGKPYYSVADWAANFYIGIPETEEEYTQTLVREYLAAINNNPQLGLYPEMGLFLQDPTMEDLVGRFGAERASKLYSAYQEFVSRLAYEADTFLETFQQNTLPSLEESIRARFERASENLTTEECIELVDETLEHLRTHSAIAFVKSARLGFYYTNRLKSLLAGIYPEDKKKVQESLGILLQGLEGSLVTEINMQIADAVNLDEAVRIGQEKLGHYSDGEVLQICHKRFSEDRQAATRYVQTLWGSNYTQRFTEQRAARKVFEESLMHDVKVQDSAEFIKTLQSAQQYMALRETVKYHFTREYEILRKITLQLAKNLNMSEEDIFSLYPWELRVFTANPKSFQHVINARKRAYTNNMLLDLPVVIREQDVDGLGLVEESVTFSELEGTLLSAHEPSTGIIVNVDKCTDLEDARAQIRRIREEGHAVVLVAKQFNLSHDPLILEASGGLIIENAAIVSHGAQRARELGIGAIGGVRTSRLETGLFVEIDPYNGKIVNLSMKET